MKLIAKHKILLRAAIATLPLLVIGCLEFDSISQPEKALIDTQIDITARIKIVPETDGTGKLVFAILAPKAWKLAENASLSLTTINYNSLQGGTDVTDETLALMPSTEVDPNTKTSWPEAFRTVKGIDKNAQLSEPVDVEWVVWRSSSTFRIDDKVNKDAVYADVKIKLTTGEDPVSCYLGYSYCYDSYGLKAGENRDASEFRPISTYGAVLATTPSVFRYGDIFALQFSPKGTALNDAAEVYLCGTAIYDGGKSVQVTAAEAKNRMEKVSSKLFEKYIYPKQFFGLPADAVIEQLWFYFSNADGSSVVTDGDKGYFVEQAAE